MGKRRADWGVGIDRGFPQPPANPPGGYAGAGGPRGAPRGAARAPARPGGGTFWRVFNNSPSRDKMEFRFFSVFGTKSGFPPYTGYTPGTPKTPIFESKTLYRRPENPPKSPKSAKPVKTPKMASGAPRAPRGPRARGARPGGPGRAPPRGRARGAPRGPPGGGSWTPLGDPLRGWGNHLRLGEFLCPCDQVSRTIRIAETCEGTGDKETRSEATSDCRSSRETLTVSSPEGRREQTRPRSESDSVCGQDTWRRKR